MKNKQFLSQLTNLTCFLFFNLFFLLGRTKKESDQLKNKDPSKKVPGMVKMGEEKRKNEAIGKQ